MANTTGKKYGGRQKGTPNRTTTEIRQMYQYLIESNLDLLENDIKELQPKERLRIIIELSKFVLPTLKNVEYTDVKNKEEENLDLSVLTDEELFTFGELLRKAGMKEEAVF